MKGIIDFNLFKLCAARIRQIYKYTCSSVYLNKPLKRDDPPVLSLPLSFSLLSFFLLPSPFFLMLPHFATRGSTFRFERSTLFQISPDLGGFLDIPILPRDFIHPTRITRPPTTSGSILKEDRGRFTILPPPLSLSLSLSLSL